jgi:hypothetical protein
MNNRFRMGTIEPPLLIKYAPNQADLQKCRQFGKKLAKDLCAQLDMFLRKEVSA